MGNVGASQLLIVAIVFVVLFGASKLPQAAKGVGQSMRILRKELRGDDSSKDTDDAALTAEKKSDAA